MLEPDERVDRKGDAIEERDDDVPSNTDDDAGDVPWACVSVERDGAALFAEDCEDPAACGEPGSAACAVTIAATCAVFAEVKSWFARLFIEQVPDPSPDAKWLSDWKVKAVQIWPSSVCELSQYVKQSLKPFVTAYVL